MSNSLTEPQSADVAVMVQFLREWELCATFCDRAADMLEHLLAEVERLTRELGGSQDHVRRLQEGFKRAEDFGSAQVVALLAVAAERDALRAALQAEDDYWAASRAHASALPRLSEGTKAALAGAARRREAARAALAQPAQQEAQ